MLKRVDLEQHEQETLAPYAVQSVHSGGRRYPEDEHPYRLAFQRDRDRIVHSSAFRRLEYKTQVFVNHEGDHFRTRLTHTLEVAQIARTIARSLRLNEDLTEAIALAHDLGHAPFGHAGERAMNEMMQPYGGFEHNQQSLRIVEVLEERYPEFPGLNLTWETRDGLKKHQPRVLRGDETGQTTVVGPSLEAQVADSADEIAYNNHDIDDGLTSQMIDLDNLRQMPLWEEHFREITHRFPQAPRKVQWRQTVRAIINSLVLDLCEETLRRLETGRIRGVDGVRRSPQRLVSFSVEMERKNAELKLFLLEHLYRHYRIIRMAEKARRIIHDLFKVYVESPKQMPPSFFARLDKANIPRVVCDYLAGMTDRYALDEHRKLFDPQARV
ncbi:MAG TPA: deoxyguanosinetriphosphate triphosphohydrolase [Gammaproteobacteria bacterium]|nr:deoxyguanosinetriphosphate triphosphohydrolase [Gammaproteobacteria bacterium]